MKLSKTLLNTMLVAITVQGTVSCTKDKTLPDQQKEKTAKEKEKSTSYPDNCPACGMG